MSLLKCDTCPSVIDTDEHPDCHDPEADAWFCPACRAATEAYWRAQYAVASPEERDPERYRREMIDAGRGHLLK